MCGIAGIIGLPPDLSREIAPRMLQALRHRGPDDSGMESVTTRLGTQVTLIHCRLAILDLSSAGRQPMPSASPTDAGERNWIVYNGEIYNYRELRDDLRKSGENFRTNTDTEVLLSGYQRLGERFVDRLRGMFAWCLFDAARQTLWFCRDRLGIKPLYLFRPESGGLLFASEVRALLAAGPEIVPRRLCAEAVESFFAQGAVYGNQSIVENVELLHPGQSLTTDTEGRKVRSTFYWTLPHSHDSAPTRTQAIDDVGRQLQETTRQHLVSDAPVGVFLSGGIDSCAIAALAAESLGSSLRTICIGFDQPEFDETEAATRVAERLGTRHLNIRLRGSEILGDIDSAMSSFDQPTVDGFNNFFVSRAASRSGLKVALSGLGGDELFGGYATFRDVPRALRWQKACAALGPSLKLAATVLESVPTRGAAKAAEFLRRPPGLLPTYFLRRELFLPAERRRLFELCGTADTVTGLPNGFLASLGEVLAERDQFNQISRLEILGYMSQMLLRDADAMSMANGLELRVPLLDHRLVELVLPLPGKWKNPSPHPKSLLIDALGSRIQRETASAPKRGFAFPWRPWLMGPLRDRAEGAIHSSGMWEAIGFRPRAVKEVWTQFLTGNRRISPLQIIAFVAFEHYVRRNELL